MTSPTVESTRPSTLLVLGLMAAVFLGVLDAQVTATALPRMVADLGGLDLFAWVTTAYLIAGSVATPLYGKLSDTAGRKIAFTTAVSVFAVGSLACALATSMPQLIAFRAVQGIGAGGLFVTAITVIADLAPPREAAKYYGHVSVVFGLASLAGPAVGGLLTDALGWRSVFYLNLPIAAFALTAIGSRLRLPVQRRRKSVDYAGIILLSAAIVAITLLGSWAGTAYAWTSPMILCLATGFVVLILTFIAAERRATEPLIPLTLFRNPTFTLSVILSVIAGFVFLGSVNFLALFTQLVTGATPTLSGVVLLPMMLGLVLSSIASTRFIRRTGTYKWFPVTSMALGAVGALLLSTMDADVPRALLGAYMAVYGIAAGLNIQVLTQAAQNTAPREHMGTVSSTIAFSRSVGTSLGISIFASIFNTHLPSTTKYLPQDAADALTPVFLVATPILLVGLLFALSLKNDKIRNTR
ncbi:MDR family MFS transporter [Actinokineospora enzanensis]|uniref:MDR family MFS transporter n=1 Tax=Actinokineospora enzanensis TaxID=155975 RepID=UPI00037AD1F2|nr:MDR family MFS transporter [Actinokineospora enzanensis]